MKIYTKTGDDGQTSILGGRRVSKSIVRLEVIGCLDELNGQIGLIVSNLSSFEKENNSEKVVLGIHSNLRRLQGELFELGADIATPFNASTSLQKSISRIPAKYIAKLEFEIDEADKKLTPLKNFILPGGHKIAANIQIARSIARRAERNLVRLQKGAKVNPNTLKYLNRLSDWLFIQARLINKITKTEETIWK
ncbi:cob(I)yrinic acid a,c-diamide adenosyltransferase [Candidatus Dojkabacteria bacterium]|nr:cob(I)yrinic acid a,c-diamide adenosyltransferase [Candidatus Dojkabacteria bacterium]